MALGSVTVEVEGVSKDFLGFELTRSLNKIPYANIIFPDTIDVSAGDEITIKEGGTVKFGGYANRINLKKDRKQKVTIYGYASEIISGKVELTNTSDSPETILASTVNGTSYSISTGSATGITVTDYTITDSRNKVFRDMTERTSYTLRFAADKTIHFDPVGHRSSGYSYNTSSDNSRVIEWDKCNLDRMANKVTVEGITSEGEEYSETEDNGTSITNYGEYFKIYQIDYLSNSTEASNVATQLLVTSPDVGGKLLTYPTSLDSYINESVSITDSEWGISSSYTCYEQKIKYGVGGTTMILQVGFPEAIASAEDKRIKWLAENAHLANLQSKKYLKKEGDTVYGDITFNTSGLKFYDSTGNIVTEGDIGLTGTKVNHIYSNYLNTDYVGIMGSSGTYRLYVDGDGQITGNLVVSDPTDSTHAATKNYVDTQVGGGGDITGPVSSTNNAITRWNGTGGDTVQDSDVLIDDSGNLYPDTTSCDLGRIGTASTWNNIYLYSGIGDLAEINSPEGVEFNVDGTRYFYVDTDGATSGAFNCNYLDPLDTSAVTVRGNLSMNSANRITNMLDPSSAQDAATKNYVDDEVAGITGDVEGPGSSTNNAIVRWNGTGGDTIQNSSVIVDDSGNLIPNTNGADLGQNSSSYCWNDLYLYSSSGNAKIETPIGLDVYVDGTRYFYVDNTGITSGAVHANNKLKIPVGTNCY